MNEKTKIVIIGCSGAGALAARMLKQRQPSLDVTIVREEDEQGLLTRCAIPYISCGDISIDSSYKDDDIFTSAGIRIVNSAAVSFDRSKKTVQCINGLELIYDKLVLAMGAQPITPPIDGIGLDGVFTLRKSGDALRILNRMNMQRIKKCVLVGAGAIGIETAYLIAKKGVRVSLVEMLPHVLPGAFDANMTSELEKYIKERNVDLRLNTKVKSLNGNSAIEEVAFDSGEKIKAEMVIVSTGVRPRIEIAKNAGLELGKLALRVNQYLQTSDPDIYAAGDLIEFANYVTGKPGLGQLRPNAVIGGRIVAKNILGRRIEYPPFINGFATKFFDKSMAGTGLTEELAKREGIETVSAIRCSDDQHSMMVDKKPFTVKLVFNKGNKRIIGGQIIGDSRSMIKSIDMLTVAIRSDWTAEKLATLRCAGQPELSPDPGSEPIALAAEEADSNML
ncbi:MAG: FAD-dependent oxidoreductase [Chitinispirillaceae bacterium]|nr:FAD-dependent oxidoreductase [Chitinispirillaceae bacterium]